MTSLLLLLATAAPPRVGDWSTFALRRGAEPPVYLRVAVVAAEGARQWVELELAPEPSMQAPLGQVSALADPAEPLGPDSIQQLLLGAGPFPPAETRRDWSTPFDPLASVSPSDWQGYARYMRDSGNPIDDVATTPLQSRVYTDAPATRSPLLTFVLAIVILAALTAAALGVVHWVQRRGANSQLAKPLAPTALTFCETVAGVHRVSDFQRDTCL